MLICLTYAINFIPFFDHVNLPLVNVLSIQMETIGQPFNKQHCVVMEQHFKTFVNRSTDRALLMEEN